ncbi:MAG: hypothetical protein LBQ70_07545, partial [Prevotellaceae bacterium]|nr:hypothetical protein [Prevotellaceae bacterium]
MKKVFKNNDFAIAVLIYSAALSAALSYFIVPWIFGDLSLSNVQISILYASIALTLISPMVLYVVTRNRQAEYKKLHNGSPMPKIPFREGMKNALKMPFILPLYIFLVGSFVIEYTVFGDFETHGWPFLQEWVARLSIAMGCGLLAGMG